MLDGNVYQNGMVRRFPLLPEPAMRRASLLISASLALILSSGFALAKDSVTIGMVLEPPGLDPTTAPAAAIGEVTHYNIFEGLTKIDEDFSVTPLLAEKWIFSPDLKTLTFTLKPNVKFQDGEPFSSKDVKFSFERFAAKDSTNKDKGFFASIQSIDTPRADDGRTQFQGPELRGALSSRHRNVGDHRREERGDRGDRPVGTGPYKLSSWTKGASITLDKWDGYREPAKIPLRACDFPLHLRSVRRGGGHARRRCRRLSPFRATFRRSDSSAAIRAFRCWSAAPRARRSWP